MRKTKIWLIIATSLVLVGGIIFACVMTALEWDFIKLSTVQYETNNYEINEKFKNISITTDTADVEFVISENTKSTVVCHEEENFKHSVKISEDTLVIEIDDERKWYEHIGVSFGQPKITVYIPKTEYGALSVKVSTGDICVGNISADEMNLSVSTGNVNLKQIKCKNFISSGSTGDISLENVVATEKFSIKRSTGDIKLNDCDASEIFIKTDTGDVKGNLLSDKVFVTHTDTGKIEVPNTVVGGKCEVTTDTGDIKIDVNKSYMS